MEKNVSYFYKKNLKKFFFPKPKGGGGGGIIMPPPRLSNLYISKNFPTDLPWNFS